MNTPKTGARCSCKPGVQRDNCGACEGTGWIIDFAQIRARRTGGSVKPNHTPAPWILDHNGHVYSQPHYQRADFTDKEGKTVEYMAGLVALPYGVNGMDHDANARLIAAAPDLLAALIELITVEDARFNMENHGLPDGVELTNLIAARAAISKATGGEEIAKPTTSA